MEPPLRILSLDGGGVRGISSLYIIKVLMTQVRLQQDGQQSNALPKPADCFDLICGTSTGGLIALMLGRLRMVSNILSVNSHVVRRRSDRKIYYPLRTNLHE